MSSGLMLWLVGGAATFLGMLLTIVLIARSMDRAGAKPAAPVKPETGLDSTAGQAMKLLFGAAIGEKVAEAVMREASKRGEGASAHRRAGVVTVSVVAGMAAAIGAAFAIRENRSVDVAVLTPVEIAAGNLHGTLLSPRENAPVVLIVPGSGPTDRDGNSPLGVRANSYRLLAQALAKEGIASVRVDKRGMFGSAAAGDPNAVTVEKYADDYRAWIDAIRAQTGRKCVWLLGHSEGALMVSATAEGRKDVCGLILVAGMGRKMGDVLREQLKANPANAMLLDQAFAAIADLEAGRHVDTSGMHSALAPLFAPQVQDFLISVFAADPVDLVRRARVKTLVVQGATDLQVTEEDARLLNDAPRTKLEFIKGMNHILKEAPEDRAANLATYTNPTLPLHPRLVRKIEDFIEGD